LTNFRPTILRFDSLPSTNTEAARQALRGAPEGLCIIAREQTAGRGRQGRAWISPPGAGLYCSLVLHPRIAVRHWPVITLMTAVAVHDALLETYKLATDIKWPNDIYMRGRKLCGILAETVEAETKRAVIVGIGINLSDRAFPQDLRDVAISIEAATGSEADIESLLHSLLGQVACFYQELNAPEGVKNILCEWAARSSYARGRRVRVTLINETLEGRTCGLEPDGALRVETDDGRIKIVRAGDVLALRNEE
jgi:BirA family biotin operon repressor/biotin-[acetyl-CoA-carboxylase] ligase